MHISWNKKTKTIVWISAGVVLLILLVIVFTRKKSKKNLPSGGEGTQGLPSESSATLQKPLSTGPPPVKAATGLARPKFIPASFPLKKGMAGKEIEQLQTFLIREHGATFPEHGVDGKWGKETHDNVTTFLKKDTVSKDFFYKTGMNKIKTNHFL